MAVLTERGQPWYDARLPLIDARIHRRLQELSARLDGGDWLEGEFSAGDLMMVTVLRRLESSGLLADYSAITSYIARAEARPAYERAFAAQLAVFTAASGD